MQVVVFGCGRTGALIASELGRAGHSVVVLDASAQQLGQLPPDFGGFALQGDASDVETLRSAKLDRADAVIAVTNDDNLNLMVAQVAARIHGVKRVYARCYDPARQEAYRELGIVIVSPTQLAAEALIAMVEAEPTTS